MNVQYSIGNGVAKELTHMTHGHEQWWGDGLRELGVMGGGDKGEKNLDNYSSMINKI